MGRIASAALTQSDARRLGRVMRALAAAGLIDEWYFVVRAPEPESETCERWIAGLTNEPAHGTAGASAEDVTP
jgi:hypothetical protein